MNTAALILKSLPTLIAAGEEIYTLVQKLLAALNQSEELTEEQEAQRDQIISTLDMTDWWNAKEEEEEE